MNKQHFDTIIVGSGTSASYCAEGLMKAGKSLAIIDELPFGGTCALRGCQPKKYLTANADAVMGVRHLLNRGITGEVSVDWQALQAHKNEFLAGKPEAKFRALHQAGVTPILGCARLTGENSVEVNGETLTADTIVLATGASPIRGQIEGNEHILNSDDFLDLPELPPRVLFIGGGYISCEFAFVAAAAGAEVTILQRSGVILRGFDADIVKVIEESALDDGIKIQKNESLSSVEKLDNGYRAVANSGAVYEVDLIIEATGRRPNLSVLDGDLGNVAHGPRGIAVNKHLQSQTNPHVYAIGDCCDNGIMLATVADEHGKLAARNIINGNAEELNLDVVPTGVFTRPQIGSVGLSEEAAVERGLDFRVNKKFNLSWPSSKRIGEKHSAYKVLIDNKTDQILGAHIARHEAAEVINLFALAMKFGITASQMAEFLYAYPTMSSDVKYMVQS